MAAHDHDEDDRPHSHDHSHLVHQHRDVQGGAARAAVFGVSDGLVSNVGLILGVAAATAESSSVLVAGIAGMLAGAGSMAGGEYLSVKAQAELVERELDIERISIAEKPEEEVRELTAIYEMRGLPAQQAREVATAIMVNPEVALEVHAREELGVDPDSVGDPVAAAASSFGAFGVGAVIPLVPWFFSEGTGAVIASIALGILAAITVGVTLAVFTERSKVRTAGRQVAVAVLVAAVTWLIGSAVGAAV